LVIADANFPAASVAAHTTAGLINCDGTDAPTLLKAIMTLLPLDPTCAPCGLMQMMPEHVAAGWKTPIWDTYKKIGEH
jgi:L-fucose mutarotase/ribose pyranase (RbsD/FucU family)